MEKNRVLFSVIFGDYENLRELEIVREENVDYILFTDSLTLQSDTWQIEKIPTRLMGDLVRSQRLIKICQPLQIKKYQQSLYIDNSVRLKKSVNQILDNLLANDQIAIPLHSYRKTVRDEFSTVLAAKLDSREKLEEQLEHYERHYPEVLSEQPFWTGIIARNNFENNINNWEQVWADHVLRYSRRDQLSLNIAIRVSNVQITPMELDNYNSDWHEWPILENRKDASRVTQVVDYKYLAQELSQQVELLSAQLDRILNSKSWKITKLLRYLNKHIFLSKRL
jgi:hypothetical protein